MKLNDFTKKIAKNVVKSPVSPLLGAPIAELANTAINTAKKVAESTKKTKTYKQVSDLADNAIKTTTDAINSVVNTDKIPHVVKETTKTAVKTNLLGKAVCDTCETVDETKKQKQAQQELNSMIERAKRLNDITQKDLDNFGETKAEILSSLSTFCDYMEKIQQRPEIKDIKCCNFTLPPITISSIEEASLNAKEIILKVAKKQFSWQSIAMIGGVGIASTIVSTLAISAFPLFSISLVARGLFSSNTSKNDDVWKLIEENKSNAEMIIKRLTEIDYAISEYLDTMTRVQGYYNVKMEQISDILKKYSKTGNSCSVSWCDLEDDERLIVQNCTLLVGLLYEMCKVKLLRVDKSKEEISVNRSVKTRMINKAENVLEQAA